MNNSNYYKYAFKEVFNILIIISIIAAGVTGFLKVAVLLLIIELLYMAVVPNLSFYKKYIDFKNNSEFSENSIFKENRKNFYNLPSPIKEKAESLQKKYNQIVKKVSKNKDFAFAIKDQINNLNLLIDQFISFSENYLSYQEYLKENNTNSILKEIEETKKSIKNNFSGLENNDLDGIHNRLKNKTVLINNLQTLEKRLSKIREITNLSESLKVQIDNIEDSFYLVSDYLMTSDSEMNNIDVNKIINEVESVESTIRQTQKEINKINNVKFDYN